MYKRQRYIYKDSLLCVSIKNIVFTEDEFRQGLRYYLLDPDTKELCSLVDYQSAGYNDADNNACYDADYLRSDGVNLCQMHLEDCLLYTSTESDDLLSLYERG